MLADILRKGERIHPVALGQIPFMVPLLHKSSRWSFRKGDKTLESFETQVQQPRVLCQ